MAIFDKSLHFGIQNFLFIESDESTDATYNYYGFMDKKGLVLLMRMLKDGSKVKYFVSNEEFDDVFADRKEVDTLYVYPNELKDLSVQ